MAITDHNIEVGDIVLAEVISGPVDAGMFLGVIARPMVAEELARTGRSSGWVAWQPVVGASFTEASAVLSLIKAHRVAADDLGVLIGIPNPIT